MKTLQIHRDPDRTRQTTGQAYLFEGEDSGIMWKCFTLELPWKDNKARESCIPDGKYTCKFTYSPKYKRNMYLIDKVPNRSGIRIHSANYFFQLLGCISMGETLTDINGDGLRDVTASRKTITEFEAIMDGEDFEIDIRTI
ncbi:MAG: DUF5675 family protein [Nitrosomonadaceae bacterium]